MSIGGTELKLYADNSAELSRMRMAIAKSLATKKARGTYRRELALRAWLRLSNAAAKAYLKEFGMRGDWPSGWFTNDDRKYAASEWLDWWTAEERLGNFESLLPAKYQKARTRKGTAKAFTELGDKQRSLARVSK